MSYMDKDSTKFERWAMLGYACAIAYSWQDMMLITVFSAFCLGMCAAMFMVIKGWTRYYTPELSSQERQTP